MSALFCCSAIKPYRPSPLDHETKFGTFMRWAEISQNSDGSGLPVDSSLVNSAPYVVQFVKQVNYGPQESIRYFAPASIGLGFVEVIEDDLLKWGFEKLNSYKNFKCERHNKFFEINLYQKNPINAHHWRVNLARPSQDIDLAFRRKKPEAESRNKTEESAGQEEKPEFPSSDIQGKDSFPELRDSLLQALQEATEPVPRKIQPAGQPDVATLKKVLRFLRPTVGTSLDESRLLNLLSLDWANAELNLGLEFESLWKAELTSSNIVNFFCEYPTLHTDTFPGVQIDLGEVEGLVIPAMRYVESRQQLAGQARFREIVNRVLDSGCMLEWVSVYGSSIARVFSSGLGDLLDRCQQRRNEHLQREIEIIDMPMRPMIPQSEEVSEESMSWMRRGEYDDDLDCDHHDSYYDDLDSDSEMKDFTACDKECGYCGKCDY